MHPVFRFSLVTAMSLAVIVAVGAVGVISVGRRALPAVSGELKVSGLNKPVEISRDDRGIPQIYASTSHDLMFAQGFVQAQDRFFEMDLRRHITAGRLAELVGNDPDAIAADRVTRTLGWRAVAEQELPLLSPATRQYLQAYADGVNAYIKDRTPVQLAVEYSVLELQLPKYVVEPWTPVDSLAWLKAMAWDLKGNYRQELTRGRLLASLPAKKIEQLYPAYAPGLNTPIITGSQSAAAGVAAPKIFTDKTNALAAEKALASAQETLAALPALLGQGSGVGSNSWVVAGSRTTTGKPLLANDPHLAPSVPNVWYQMGLHCVKVSPACPFDVSGFSFAGTPGIIVGHNAKISWGLTNLGADVTDFYLERIIGGRAEYDSRYEDIGTKNSIIKVRGAADIPITIRSTRHGPVLSDVIPELKSAGREVNSSKVEEVYDVALAWTALTPGKTAEAIFGFNAAGDWDSFRKAASLFEVPSQNLVYADTSGNIGYQAPGKIPVRSDYDGRWPVPGWESSHKWESYVPFEQLPKVFNPDEGFIVAANQAVTAENKPFLTSDWGFGYRSQRIRTVLSSTEKISARQMQTLQIDTKNPVAANMVPLLQKISLKADPFSQDGQKLLKNWDATQPADSAPAAYFNAVWANIIRLTFNDELSGDLAADGGEDWFAVVQGILNRPADPWWDNKATPAVIEGRDEIFRQAMVAARVELTRSLGKDVTDWEWGKLHQLTVAHPVLGGSAVPGLIRGRFNRGPFQLAGGSGAVDATAALGPDYAATNIPAMRMIVDLGDLDRSQWVIAGGASGHPADSHYFDQWDAWAAGGLYRWPFTKAAVDAATGERLVLSPGEDAVGG